MMFAGRPRALAPIAPLLAAFALGGCGSGGDPYSGNNVHFVDPQEMPPCDKSIEIKADSNALMVTDPEILSKLQLKDVLQQIIDSKDDRVMQPLEMMQRLFDTNNRVQASVFPDGVKCDSFGSFAHVNGESPSCPRMEGSLAASTGFFTPGDPDYFYPVAAVNRMDLMPFLGATCGEYRIVYAKQSGLTDPNNRVFLIFEMSIPNPHNSTGSAGLFGCRPVAELWKSLDDETDKAVLADRLHSFFFEGLPDSLHPVEPPIHAKNLGFGSVGGLGYYNVKSGQLRVSQHLDEFWEMRQMVPAFRSSTLLTFVPVTLSNNPLPSRFEDVAYQEADRAFADDFVMNSVDSLASKDRLRMSMTVRAEDLSGESELGGAEVNDYAGRGSNNQYLHDVIAKRIAQGDLGAGCPADDPLTPEAILRRATMDSCAGCHAPSQFLGPERKIGCGLTWPDSLGEVHINEKGERSPALTEVFLPHRAEVMTTYMQACSIDEINAAFGGGSSGTSTKSADLRRTIGGSSTH